MRLPRFLQRDSYFGNEIGLALCGFGFFKIGSQAGTSAKQLIQQRCMRSFAARECAVQAYDATRKFKRSLVNVSNHF